MRRGHPGVGGWRNENPRHFRPRGSGTPHFRPPRGYGLLDTPRFPPPGPRGSLPRGPPPFAIRPNVLDNRTTDHDRSKYRHDNRQNNPYRIDRSQSSNQRSIFPILDRIRQSGTDHGNQYNDHGYYDNTHDPHINSMGDVDHRQSSQSDNPDVLGHPAWSHPPPNVSRQFIEDRHQYRKPYKHHDNPDGNKIPSFDYTGHRPPASDHYGGNPSSSIDNSNSFSRSVDDTVDIVRRRLQNRNDPQSSEDQPIDHQDEDLRVASTSQSYHNPSEVQPVKKKTHRQRHSRNIESNCDKMKSKIVHELFKMDKGRIHKLMDNPSSSTKFEYAISSLITESQNSLNKHMRSVAEKSLSSSEDFICNDNNTIYEDTFMKQMQYILDPQDTVLLEDIKPLVMEELSKVLQLNEYDQPFQMVDEHSYTAQQEQPLYDSYTANQPYDYNDYENNYYDEVNSPAVFDEFTSNSGSQRAPQFSPEVEEKPEPLFERRSRNRSKDRSIRSHERSFSSEERPHSRVNIDLMPSREEPTFSNERRPARRSSDRKQSEDKNKDSEPQVPLFDSNTQFSEEDDPFAELDKQYHVAVDHTFIDTYDLSSPQQTPTHNMSKDSTDSRKIDDKLQTSIKTSGSIIQELDSQLFDMAKPPVKLLPAVVNNNGPESRHKHRKSSHSSIKKEAVTTPTKEDSVSSQSKIPHLKQESSTESATETDFKERSENAEVPSKSLVSSSSRKRSVDQRPSHRKEKRKKSETTPSDSNQQILNKNIIINVNDCTTKDKEKCTDTAKSIFNLFFSKNASTKETPKKGDTADKSYSDKYVKRKEPSKKKEGEVKPRQRSISSSHSIISPKESANNTQAIKTESKTKLQSIDMFTEQPRKTAHQAHKNTGVPPPATPVKVTEPSKTKPTHVTSSNRKPVIRTVATQVTFRPAIRKISVKETKSCTSRFSQTEKKRTLGKAVQTDPVKFEKGASKATDAFERMKEIDMEIQVLLQEKFKIYSSLESNSSCPNTMQATLGMAVLNVPLNEAPVTDENNADNSTSEEDAIVDDFTNIPVEELEQIAMESVEHPSKQSDKRTRRNKLLDEDRQSSASPPVKKSNRKAKTPNISLIEQIIDDDRPLEDIISLDDYETTPVKSKKTSTKSKKKNQKKTKPMKQPNYIPNLLLEFGIKECFVLLERKDYSKFLKAKLPNQVSNTEKIKEQLPEVIDIQDSDVIIKPDIEKDKVHIVEEVIEETVLENDIQIDMMDVSEDIIIGDNCEVKSSDDKEAERSEVTINEEIILDNSQSSEPVQGDGGQGENICKMYDYSADENLRRDAVTVTGHADAVLAIECIDNNFVAACLDGNVYYFSNDGQLLSTLRGSNFAVTCLAIVKGKYETTVYTGSLDSRIRYYDLDTGLEKGPECNVLSPIQTMDRAWDTIFVGTRTGFVLQFECKNNMLIPVSTVKFSDQSILALRAMKEGPRKVLLVAARSEDVTIKDAQTGLLLRTLQGPKMTVYTLLYEDGKVYCGTSSNQIHVFDYTSGSHAGVHEGGKGAVCLRATGGLLFAGCYDGCVYVYREGEPRPLAQLRGPSLMLLSLAVRGSKIIAGYKDRSLYIWKIPLSILQEMIL